MRDTSVRNQFAKVNEYNNFIVSNQKVSMSFLPVLVNDDNILEGENSFLLVAEYHQVRSTAAIQHDRRTAHKIPYIISLRI